MRAKIREILEECIENGIVLGYAKAHKHTDDPSRYDIQQNIEDAIWLEIDERFDFERNLCDEVVKGFDHLEKYRPEDVCKVDSYIGRVIESLLKEKNT